MVPEYRNATSANTEPVAAKSYTMGHRPRVGASAAPNCGQAERRNLGRRRERMILLDMGGLAAISKVGYQSAIYKNNDALIFVPILLKNRTEINQIQ